MKNFYFNKDNLKLLLKVFLIFLTLYFLNNITELILLYLGDKNYNELNISYNSYIAVNYALGFFPIILFLILIVIYLHLKKIKIDFIIKKNKIVGKIFISFVLIYLVSLIPDPFYHNFSMTEIPLFKLNWVPFKAVFIEIFTSLIIAPLFEELFFRFILLRFFIKEKKIYIGIVTTSILYSLGHFYIINSNFNLDYLSLLNLFLIGVVFSILRIKYGLLFAVLAHFFYNLLGLIYQKGIVNLYVLDYLKSNYHYWSIYSFIVLIILYLGYILLKHYPDTQVQCKKKQ